MLKAARPDLDPSTEGLLRRIEKLERGTEASGPAGPVTDRHHHPLRGRLRRLLGVVPQIRATPRQKPPRQMGLSPKRRHKLHRPGAEPEASADSSEGPEASTVKPEPTESSDPAESFRDAETEPSAEDDPPAGGGVGGTTPEDALATGRGGGSPAPTGPAGQDALDLEYVIRFWPAVIDKLRETSPALAATFEGARPVGVDEAERIVTIGFPAENTFNKRKAEAPEKREQMEDALEAVVGERLRPTYVVLEDEAAAPEGDSADEIDHDALVEKLKSEFDAEEVG